MQKRVVYVDDEPFCLKALSRLFHDEDFDFVTFDSPGEALMHIDALKPSVVISDLRMPAMNGIEFLEKVKDRHPDGVRIILTGHADLETVIEALNKGCIYRFIQKPWDNNEIKEQIKFALQHQASDISLRGILEILAEELLENEKSQEAFYRLAEVVSNEIEQPLIIIAGYLRLLQAGLPDDELTRKYMTNIRAQLDLLADKTARLKSMPRAMAKMKTPG